MIAATRRIALTVGGAVYDQWTAAEIVRDLAELSGSFTLELREAARSAAFPSASRGAELRVEPGVPVTVAIDGEPVLVGYVDDVEPHASEGFLQTRVSGRDKTADLIDCAAAPKGPSEFKGLTLTQIAQRLAAPFGIAVRAEADVGAAFPRFVVDAGETAKSAIEKAARQRAVLVASDGVGGLVLTRGGSTRMAGVLACPGNVIESEGRFSWRERFSDYYVQSQVEKAAQLDRTPAALTADQAPRPAPVAPDAEAEEKGVVVTGHARDPTVDRHRPTVSVARMQTYAAPARTTAEWMMRTARAKASLLTLTVKDYRNSASGAALKQRSGSAMGELWRPNALVFVDDRFQGVYRLMLIAGVAYRFDARAGETTQLKLVGRSAYDLLPEAGRDDDHEKPLDSTARGLTEPVRDYANDIPYR